MRIADQAAVEAVRYGRNDAAVDAAVSATTGFLSGALQTAGEAARRVFNTLGPGGVPPGGGLLGPAPEFAEKALPYVLKALPYLE
jgi:hypothetical protein